MPGNSAKGAKRKAIIEAEESPQGYLYETPSVHLQTAFLFLNFFNKMRSFPSAVSGRCL